MTAPLRDLLDGSVPYEALAVTVDSRLRTASWWALLPPTALGALLWSGDTNLDWLPPVLTLRACAVVVLGGASLAAWTRGFRSAGRLLHAALVVLVLAAAASTVLIPFAALDRATS